MTLKRVRLPLAGAGILLACALGATPAAAQASRTWVSGVGDDANPCSRTAPCKTFAGAISKTAAGGEINCIDPGGYGSVTIAKAMTIDCTGTFASILNAGTNGVVVNAGANDVITLRGFEINASSDASPGINGIRFLAGGSLMLENMVIRGNRAVNGRGISFQPSGASKLFLNNVVISNNGNGATGGGVLIQPTGTGSANVVLNGVLLRQNVNNHLRIDTTGNTGGGINVAVTGSEFSGGAAGAVGSGVSVLTPSGTTGVSVVITDSLIANTSTALLGDGSLAFIEIGNSTIFASTSTPISALNGAKIASFGTNQITANANNSAPFSAPLIPPR